MSVEIPTIKTLNLTLRKFQPQDAAVLHRTIARVYPENSASLRVVEKCGMHYQDTLDLWGIVLTRHPISAPIHPF